MNELPWSNNETIVKSNTLESKQNTSFDNVPLKLIAIKQAELKDEINTFFDAFNNEIKSMTPSEISNYYNTQINEFLDFQSENLKNLPDSISWEIKNLIQTLWEEIKIKSLDWNLSDQEQQELMNSIFKHSNQLANTLGQEANNL